MRILIVTAGLWLAGAAWAQQADPEAVRYFPQQLTAQDLLNACASSALTHTGRQRRRYCAGFISGVEEAVRLMEARDPDAARTVCAPAGVTARRLAAAYLEFMPRRSPAPGEPAAAAVLRALTEAYPCSS